MKQVNYIGSAVRKLRMDKHMSQEALAKASGISPSAICRYECGNREPGIKAIMAIADALGLTVSNIYLTAAEME